MKQSGHVAGKDANVESLVFWNSCKKPMAFFTVFCFAGGFWSALFIEQGLVVVVIIKNFY